MIVLTFVGFGHDSGTSVAWVGVSSISEQTAVYRLIRRHFQAQCQGTWRFLHSSRPASVCSILLKSYIRATIIVAEDS